LSERKLQLLEERVNELILLTDERKLLVVEKDPYSILKYIYYQGKKIRYVANDQNGTTSIQENSEIDGVFECIFNGSKVTIRDSKVQVAKTILESQASGKLDAIYAIWKVKYVEAFLGITISNGGSRIVEFTPQGHLSIPESVYLEILEWMERPDGARVAKIYFRRRKDTPPSSSPRTDRIFTHEIIGKVGRATRIIVNDIAVALMGRDETSQYWMHIVPPEYMDSPISLCELWLAGGENGKDELIEKG
jgi:hypothetical protein